MRKHTLDKLMDRLSLLLLLGTVAFLVVYWRHIPEEVPCTLTPQARLTAGIPREGF